MSFLSPVTYWGLAAAIPAVLLEYLFRRLSGPYFSYWYVFIPLAIVINYAVCQLVRQPNVNLIDAFIVFAFCTTLSRVALSLFVLGDKVNTGTWIALSLLLLARLAQSFWGK